MTSLLPDCSYWASPWQHSSDVCDDINAVLSVVYAHLLMRIFILTLMNSGGDIKAIILFMRSHDVSLVNLF